MIEAALFIIGAPDISDAEIRFCARHVSRTVSESDELAHLQATYLFAIGSAADGPPTESAIAVFQSVDAKATFDEQVKMDGRQCYTREMFDGYPVIDAVGQWSQQDAIDATGSILADVRKAVDGFGLIQAVARQFYISPNVLFSDGALNATRSLLERIEANTVEQQRSAAAEAVSAKVEASGQEGASDVAG